MGASDLPDMAHRLWSTDVAKAVRDGDYDAVQAEGIEMARYLFQVPPERRIYDAHNAEFLLQQRLAHSSRGLRAAYSRMQWRRLERFEAAVVRQSRLTLAVSEHDANQLSALAGPDTNVRVVPNGIDVAAYPFRPPSAARRTDLLFLGKLDFRPNAASLAWFIPDVLGRLSDTRLFVVGAAPPAWLVKAGQHDSRIAVTGHVADERPYFARCAALVLPVRTGGGSRLKALVAMASGVPIVSTRLGMEGLEAEPSVHYLVADSPEEWVSSLRRLLADADLRQRLACNARSLVEQRYDWSALRPKLEAAYAWLSR
jgi:glycosyltransferase involved in cell wall biosynthesis